MTLIARLKRCLPENIHFAVRDPRESFALIGSEHEAIARAIPKRKTEFSAGRDAARDALAQLGLYGVEIPVGERRAPHWPDGICGSITHSKMLCIAAVARKSVLASIGIDAEPDVPLKEDLRNAILHDSELHVSAEQAIALFSMKEALFKALFPLTGKLMGFHAAKSDGATGLILTGKVGSFPAGTRFDVPVLRGAGHVISHCVVKGLPS